MLDLSLQGQEMDIFPRMLCIDFRCYLSVSSLGLARNPKKDRKGQFYKTFWQIKPFLWCWRLPYQGIGLKKRPTPETPVPCIPSPCERPLQLHPIFAQNEDLMGPGDHSFGYLWFAGLHSLPQHYCKDCAGPRNPNPKETMIFIQKAR